MRNYLFFDHASTTKCCPEAAELVHRFNVEDFGNPSSSHAFGMTASKAIQDARAFFAQEFKVKPAQVIFTGSGSESDNLAIYGIAMKELAQRATASEGPAVKRPRFLFSAIEHAAVRKTMLSLNELGFDALPIPVDGNGLIRPDALADLLTPETRLVSIMQVNNVVGSIQSIEELGRLIQTRAPRALFHCDAVQSFGKLPTLTADSGVDLVSISAHKIEGPKGVGALVVLNPKLMKNELRPMIWGGDQEGGLRSGTPNAGLIAGFHAAAKKTLEARHSWMDRMATLNRQLAQTLETRGLLGNQPGQFTWNSPTRQVAPHIVSLSLQGYPSTLLAALLEQRGCLVSTGSACSSGKPEPDPVLVAMALPAGRLQGAIRISFSSETAIEDISVLVDALEDSAQNLRAVMGS